jgi:hypothetical protein
VGAWDSFGGNHALDQFSALGSSATGAGTPFRPYAYENCLPHRNRIERSAMNKLEL